MSKSLVDKIRKGGHILYFGLDGYSVEADSDSLYIICPDGDASITVGEAQDLHALLDAWLKIQRTRGNG